MTSKCLILDIDNCIADDAWRIPRIDWHAATHFDRYHHYHQLSAWDKSANKDLWLGREERILLLTSRPVHYRTLTEEWLLRAGVYYEHLLMRNDADHRPSHLVKADQVRWLSEYGVHLEEIACAYDDRELVLAEYRRLGLKTELRTVHDVSAYRGQDVK